MQDLQKKQKKKEVMVKTDAEIQAKLVSGLRGRKSDIKSVNESALMNI